MYMIYIHFNSCKTFLFFINSIWRLLVKFVFYFLRWSFLFCPMDLWVMEFHASPALKVLNCPLQYWSITFQCIFCIRKPISNTHVWKIELSASLLIIKCSSYFVKFCYSAFKNTCNNKFKKSKYLTKHLQRKTVFWRVSILQT